VSSTLDEVRTGAPIDGEESALQGKGDRRALLKVGAAAIAGMLAPAVARAQGVEVRQPRRRRAIGTSAKPTMPIRTPQPVASPAVTGWDLPELRLARRITMGLTEAEGVRARAMGYSAYLEYHLNAAAIDDSATETFIATTYPYVYQSVLQLYSLDGGAVETQLTSAWIYRAAFSARQLQERAVEFWTDHFNIAITKVGYLKVVDDRDVIRKYALDTFPSLLKASAHSGAMLAYLDQTLSKSSAPNQNYAREIMELHTLGVDGGYTQTDVAELARVLTGWTIAGRGTFAFDQNLHDFGAKTVMGVTIPAAARTTGAAAQAEGEQMLDFLLAHPSTATFVSKKMLRFFLSYEPSAGQIAEVAAVYKSTGGDIKAMLRTVLSAKNLATAPVKLKRPFHLVASTVRALGPNGAIVTNVNSLSRQITTIGQQPYYWQTPDGYPDQIEYWAGNILTRWNFASAAGNANGTDFKVDITPFTFTTADGVVNAISRYLFAGEMLPSLRDELKGYLGTAQPSATKIRETLALALSSATFQYF
jgi:uncharacterized protein (DUF1800 family)